MTAAISSRSAVAPAHSEEVDSAPPPAAPPPPTARARANQVESWPGQAPRTQEVVAQIEKMMMKNSAAPVRDFCVTERDAREAVAMLGQLPGAEYKKAIADMNSKALGQMLSEMDADTRKTFFTQARQRGVVKEEPGVKMPPREGSPPDKPALLRNDPTQRTELQTAILEENKARTSQYMREFDGYISRYSEAALNASSPLALRLIGPPASEFVLTEPGSRNTLDQGPTNRARAAKAANDRISDFAGRTRAGSFSATVEGKLAADINGHGAEASYSARLTDYGKFTDKVKGEAEVAVVRGLSVGMTSEGRVYAEAGAGDFRVRRENGKFTEAEAKIAGIGVLLTEEKTTLSLSQLPIGAFATIDEKAGSYGGGVKVGGKETFGMVSVEASLKVGISVQGIAPERLAAIASMQNDGIWGPMPELDGRVKWNDIPKPRRERLASDGWSSSNWPVR